MSWFKDFTDKVQSALPKLDNESLMESLTLTTPALKAERERIDAEEKRKERVRNMLAGMLPWQTRDPERDILVEECKEAILLLSKDKATFFGPFQVPLHVDARTEVTDEEENEKESMSPSKESLEKLAKLEPLPPLLQNFDLLNHVGLIEKMLAEDPRLVKMQSTLSGGGARERVFWKNYFFHCAYTRYEAGLSVDEIWCDMPDEERHHQGPVTAATAAKAAAAAATPSPVDDGAEETITFDGDADAPATGGGGVEHQVVESAALFGSKGDVNPTSAASNKATAKLSESDYEMVGEDGIGDDGEGDTGDDDSPTEAADYELDELEAEIARELED